MNMSWYRVCRAGSILRRWSFGTAGICSARTRSPETAREGGGTARKGGGTAREGGGTARAGGGTAREGGDDDEGRWRGTARKGGGTAREGGGTARGGGETGREGGGTVREGGDGEGRWGHLLKEIDRVGTLKLGKVGDALSAL